MKTIRVFTKLSGNQYEHVRDERDGQDIPVSDDTVYVKMHKGYQPTKKRILCAQCGHRRSACHCAGEPGDTLGQVVTLQAERRGETAHPPEPPARRPAAVHPGRLGTFTSASHAALACRTCGFVSCQCPVVQPGSTLDGVLTVQRAQGKR